MFLYMMETCGTIWNEFNEYIKSSKTFLKHKITSVFVVVVFFWKDLKCVQNDVLINNNYPHLYILV